MRAKTKAQRLDYLGYPALQQVERRGRVRERRQQRAEERHALGRQVLWPARAGSERGFKSVKTRHG
eukprot:1701090-Pleurochrysis_carterae.AAC.1